MVSISSTLVISAHRGYKSDIICGLVDYRQILNFKQNCKRELQLLFVQRLQPVLNLRILNQQCFIHVENKHVYHKDMFDYIAPSFFAVSRLNSHFSICGKQRNNVLHNNFHIPPEALFKCIDRVIRNMIHARKVRKKFRDMLSRWLG